MDSSDQLHFWSQVQQGVPAACWPWIGNLSRGGYGRAQWKGKTRQAHRGAYLLARGTFDDGLCVLHNCDNRRCCNPAHLYLGTPKDNYDDLHERGRPQNRLSAEDVHLIIAYIEAGHSRRDVARMFGIGKDMVHAIAQGRAWKNVTAVPWTGK